MRTKAFCYSFVLLLLSCSAPQKIQPSLDTAGTNKAKNIIFMIGDGMGLTQVSVAGYALKRPLNLDRFNNIGLQLTHSKSDLITDSAASAAAMSRGIKTDNSTFGSTLDAPAPSSVLEICERNNWETGIVVTSSVTHATPAAFVTYQQNRSMDEGIALDYVSAGVDYLVGGGKKFFDRRTDERNLIEEMKTKGYAVRSYLDGTFEDNISYADRQYVYFTSDSKPLPSVAGRDYLSEASTFGVRFLRNRADDGAGFFILIEGSQIDWAGHANDFEWLISEIKDFDRVVGQMLDYAIKDGETLLVVTADHETGGLSLLARDPENNKLVTSFSTKLHSGVKVPVYAYGPGSELFRGVYDNTEIKDKLLQAAGL